MRRTVMNLAKQLNTSRPRIYRAMKRLDIEVRNGAEFSVGEWAALTTELTKKPDAQIGKAGGFAADAGRLGSGTVLADITTATLRERLGNSKSEYDYNLKLISQFQHEIDEYILRHGTTCVQMPNGAVATISSVANLDKYIKLNIQLSKLISAIEADLDLMIEDGEDMYG